MKTKTKRKTKRIHLAPVSIYCTAAGLGLCKVLDDIVEAARAVLDAHGVRGTAFWDPPAVHEVKPGDADWDEEAADLIEVLES